MRLEPAPSRLDGDEMAQKAESPPLRASLIKSKRR